MPTEAGKDATRDETVTAIDQTGAEYIESAAQSVSRSTHSQGDALDQPVQVDGIIKRRANKPTEFGKDATVDEEVTAVDQTGEIYEDDHSQLSVALTHTQGDALAQPTALDGQIVRSRNAPTEFGKDATVQETIVAKDQESSRTEETHARTTTVTEHTQGDALPAASEVVGEINSNSESPTPFGKFRTQEQTISAKDQTGEIYNETHARSVVGTTHTQGDALSSPAITAGNIKRRRNAPTEFGKDATLDETITAVDQTGNEKAVNAARTVTRNSHTQNSSALPDPAQANGFTKRTTNAPTEFGLDQTINEVVEAHDQTGEEWEVSAARTVTRGKHTQGEALTQPSQVDGYIKQNRNTPTEFGKDATVEDVIEIHDQQRTTTEDNAAVSSTATTHTSSDALSTASASAGTHVKHVNRPTPEGRSQTEEIVQTAKAQDTGWVAYTDRWGISYSRRYTNQNAPLVDGYTDSTNNSHSVVENKFGRFDGSGSRKASRATNVGSDAVILSAQTFNIKKLQTRKLKSEPTQYRWNTYQITTNIESTYAGAQNVRAGFSNLTEIPTISKKVDAVGIVWYEVVATEWLSSEAWQDEPEGGPTL